jgi:DNA mismatch repair ATPase MutL
MIILDKDTINKIGSELVLTDTKAMVKELIENSLDARSTRIEIK